MSRSYSQGSGDPGHDLLRVIAGYTESAREGKSSNKPIRMGRVDFDYDPTDYLGGVMPRILFDGESVVSQKRYPVMAGYYPLPGARVVLIPIGTTYLVMGTSDTKPQDPRVQMFTTVGTDTWEKPLGARTVRVQVQAGGGAGGGAPATAASQTSAGSGGAGGGYGESWFSANALPASVTVAVPTGGTGSAGAAGTSGGVAAFGSFVSADGGGGGTSLAASGTPSGNQGAASTGQAITADLAIQGQGGGSGARLGTNGAIGGMGGNSHLGGGGTGRGVQTGSNTGSSGGNYGSGGSGGAIGPSLAATSGGHGGQGCVIITTYF